MDIASTASNDAGFVPLDDKDPPADPPVNPSPNELNNTDSPGDDATFERGPVDAGEER